MMILNSQILVAITKGRIHQPKRDQIENSIASEEMGSLSDIEISKDEDDEFVKGFLNRFSNH